MGRNFDQELDDVVWLAQTIGEDASRVKVACEALVRKSKKIKGGRELSPAKLKQLEQARAKKNSGANRS